MSQSITAEVLRSRMPKQSGAIPDAPPTPLAIPHDALYGRLGEIARSLDCPMNWSYPSLLTLTAGMWINTGEKMKIRPQLYTLLVGPPGDGKSTTANRAVDALQVPDNYIEASVPGSDRGLAKMFPADDSGLVKWARSVTLVQDEFRSLLSKAMIKGSTLCSLLNTLYYNDQAGSADKTGHHKMQVRLSLLGCLACDGPDHYRELMSSEVTTGFSRRIIVCPSEAPVKLDFSWEPTLAAVHPQICEFDWSLKAYHDEWCERGDKLNLERSRLRSELALRVALIASGANHDKLVTTESLKAAHLFAEWQERVAMIYHHSSAVNIDGTITTAIIEAFRAEHAANGASTYVNFTDLANKKRWYSMWGKLVTAQKNALVDAEILIAPVELDEKGNEKRRTRSNLFKLVKGA